MRVLITGGAGFIASHIADAHLRRGDEVLVADNLCAGRRENVPQAADFAQLDITDEVAVHKLWDDFRPDIVSHHAAQIDVRRSLAEPAFDARVNIIGSINVIKNCVDYKTRRIVFASSGGAIYGEMQGAPPTEDTPIQPVSLYGVAKYSVEQYLAAYGRAENIACTILRYANVYGPRQRTDGEAGVVAIFAGLMLDSQPPTIFGCGDKTRDYVYVADVVRANMMVLEHGGTGPYNIGTGVETSDQQVFDAVAAATGYDGDPIYGDERKGDVHRIALNSQKATNEFGWHAQTEFSEGIARTVDYIRRHH
jgi:UDP-glucose 4-epimerase